MHEVQRHISPIGQALSLPDIGDNPLGGLAIPFPGTYFNAVPDTLYGQQWSNNTYVVEGRIAEMQQLLQKVSWKIGYFEGQYQEYMQEKENAE